MKEWENLIDLNYKFECDWLIELFISVSMYIYLFIYLFR